MEPTPAGIIAVGFIGRNPTNLLNRILDSHTSKEWLFGESRRRRHISYRSDSQNGVVFLQYEMEQEQEQEEDLKDLLFMFSVCHIIVFVHDGSRFDTQLLKKFRVLQSSKHALLPFLNPNPNNSNLARGGLTARHTSTQFSPVILFIFQDNFSPDASNSNKKRLISSLESQIRFLLKKLHLSSRFSGNSTYTPLFSLDASRSVSLLDSLTNQKAEALNHISNVINSSNFSVNNENMSQFVNNEEVQVIRDFISRNSEILRGRITGNSNPGSVAASAIKEVRMVGKSVNGLIDLPNLENFLALSKSILSSLIGEYDNNNENIEGVLCTLERSKDLNEKFSILWCEKTIPICKEVYLKDLPKYYRTDMHEKHLKKALDVFRNTVKGTAVKRFTEKLENECNLIWKNGRQQCDSLSLTKRPCIHQKHNNNNNFDNLRGDLVNLRHSSGFYFLHACACGRSRALRDDPFELETGQDAFNAGFKCEKEVATIEIINKDGRKGIWRLVRIGSFKYYNPKKGILQTGFCNKEKFLFCWKIKCDINKEGSKTNFITKKPFSEVVKTKNKNIISFHEENKNVIQIGGNIIPVNTKSLGTKMNNSTEEFNAYLGFEHECPFGHRFFLSEKHLNNNNGEEFCILDRKIPIFMNCPHCVGSDELKNENQKIKFAGKISQLQRIFIVTPKLPVLLATCPVVQFEESCLPDSVLNKDEESRFGFESRVLLPPDSFLSLRLPFIYSVKMDNGDMYPLDPFHSRPDKTAWLVQGSALELVSVGEC